MSRLTDEALSTLALATAILVFCFCVAHAIGGFCVWLAWDFVLAPVLEMAPLGFFDCCMVSVAVAGMQYVLREVWGD